MKKLKELNLKAFKYVDLLKDFKEEDIEEFIKKNWFKEYIIENTNEKTWVFYCKEKLNKPFQLMNELDRDSYLTSFSALQEYWMLTDVVFNEKRNSSKYWFIDTNLQFQFNKVDEIKKEDFIFNWYRNIATKERAIFDFFDWKKKWN